MKYIVLIPLMLMIGCVTQEKRDPTLCIEWQSYEVPREECTGGRGVAPQICITRTQIRHFCVRWEEE